MKSNRRKFISAAIAGGLTATTLPFTYCRSESSSASSQSELDLRYARLDEALKLPVLKRELFPSPVIIDTIELLRNKTNFICRVRSKEGAEGISIGHPNQHVHSWPMFTNLVQPFFKGKDARDLDKLIEIREHTVKLQGIPLCVNIATVEFAILDMLGNIANKTVGQLIGDIHNPEIAYYQSSRFNELRLLPPEESLKLVKEDLMKTNAKAIKLRAGPHQNNKFNTSYYPPGRTEKLISMARKEFGDEMVMMIDANGSYALDEAVRIGRILEEHNFLFYEEPVPWNYREETQQVKEALNIQIASGEEEFDMHVFRWLIGHNAIDIVQPDLFYFGGIIRSMKVARMAAALGKAIVPHQTEWGLGYIYLLNFISACPNAGPYHESYHEFNLSATTDANGNKIPVESKSGPFVTEKGRVKILTGPGLGVVIDPDFIKAHSVVKA